MRSARSAALAIAAAATTLCLGLPVERGVIGRGHSIRVLLAAAIVLIAVAALSAMPARRRGALLGAIASLGASIALVLDDVARTGLVVLIVAMVALIYAHRQESAATA